MTSELIFISFSRRCTQKVARIIYQTLTSIYPDEKVKVFFSEVSLNAGSFDLQIRENLKRAKVAISVLTPENQRNSPWLMYEAGALRLSVENNGGELLPYLFCRHRRDVDAPISPLQNYQYQRGMDQSNREQFLALCLQIDHLLAPENQVGAIALRSVLNQTWPCIAPQFKAIADELYDPAISAIDRASDSTENVVLDAGIFATTIQQGVAMLADDFSPSTPADMENQFAKVLDFYIPNEWKAPQTDKDREYRATRVVVNDTRISTFVAFTDGENILLFDRSKEERLTNVTNNRFDVFGSVQFENRGIPIKIDNIEFLGSPISRTVPLYGAAFENNRLRVHDDVETVVMFGVIAYMRPEHLLLAKKSTNQGLMIIPLSKAKALPQEKLTSKARLAIAQL